MNKKLVEALREDLKIPASVISDEEMIKLYENTLTGEFIKLNLALRELKEATGIVSGCKKVIELLSKFK